MDKTKSKQNKITDAPQPKPCSHGTNKRMQKQIQKQKTTASLVRIKVTEIYQSKFKSATTNNTGHQTKQSKAATPQQYRHIHTTVHSPHYTTDHSPPRIQNFTHPRGVKTKPFASDWMR